MAVDPAFWKTKTLEEMTTEEWESLCDGCGRCCLHKLRFDEDNSLGFTNVACRLLDLESCRCSRYATRQRYVPDCVSLTPAELREIERRRARYLGSRARAEIAGHVAIVVDDGIATGATTRAALRAVRQRQPKTLVLAVPVAPSDTLDSLRREVDDLVCLEAHDLFGAIGLLTVLISRIPAASVDEEAA